MMVLVVRRSNVRHVSLTCDQFGAKRVVKNKYLLEEAQERNIVKLRETPSKKKGCSFEIRGVRERKMRGVIENQKWRMFVVNGEHNHKLPTSFQGHAFMGKLKPEEKLMIRTCLKHIFV